GDRARAAGPGEDRTRPLAARAHQDRMGCGVPVRTMNGREDASRAAVRRRFGQASAVVVLAGAAATVAFARMAGMTWEDTVRLAFVAGWPAVVAGLAGLAVLVALRHSSPVVQS